MILCCKQETFLHYQTSPSSLVVSGALRTKHEQKAGPHCKLLSLIYLFLSGELLPLNIAAECLALHPQEEKIV